MKRILLLLTTSIVLLACSNDDNNPLPEEQNPEMKIQKFSRTVYEPNGEIYRIDQLFDETGKITNRIEDYFNENIVFNDTYSYNNLDQVSVIQLRNVQEDSLRRKIIYTYNESSHKIKKIQWIDSYGDIGNTIQFTHDGSTVTTEDDFQGYKIFTFGGNGKLIKTISTGGDILRETVSENINYSENLISSLNYESSLGSSENYVFEYDDKTNPLFKSFDENINNYIYGFVGNMKYQKFNFSPKNYTKIKYTSSTSTYNYIETKTTEYNESGYPTSAVIKKDDVLIEELTYEYY